MKRRPEDWHRMSKGCKLPEMHIEYSDGEVEHIPSSWQCFYVLRSTKLGRPVRIVIMEDVDAGSYYTFIRPSLDVFASTKEGAIKLVNGAVVTNGRGNE